MYQLPQSTIHPRQTPPLRRVSLVRATFLAICGAALLVSVGCSDKKEMPGAASSPLPKKDEITRAYKEKVLAWKTIKAPRKYPGPCRIEMDQDADGVADQVEAYEFDEAGVMLVAKLGQENHHYTYDKAGNRIQSKSQFGGWSAVYDKHGNRTFKSEYVGDSARTTDISWAYTYDSQGRKITSEQRGTPPRDTTIEHISFTYHDNGKLALETRTRSSTKNEKKQSQRAIFHYDKNGRLFLSEFDGAGKHGGIADGQIDDWATTKWTLDENGFARIQEYDTGRDGIIEQRTYYHFDDKGNERYIELDLNGDGSIDSIETYFYDCFDENASPPPKEK